MPLCFAGWANRACSPQSSPEDFHTLSLRECHYCASRGSLCASTGSPGTFPAAVVSAGRKIVLPQPWLPPTIANPFAILSFHHGASAPFLFFPFLHMQSGAHTFLYFLVVYSGPNILARILDPASIRISGSTPSRLTRWESSPDC